jgi:uncharacterized delta-60 repeat protein
VTLVQQPSGHAVLAFQTADSDFGLARFDTFGQQDFDFGQFGLATTNFGDTISAAVASHVVTWNDSYVVAGTCVDEEENSDICLAEIAPNGATISQRYLGLEDIFSPPIVVRSADRMLVIAANIFNGLDRNLLIRKIFKDGSIDSTFGDLGTAIVDFPEGDEYPIRAVVEADGSVLVTLLMAFPSALYSSYELIRIGANGQLDSTFGNAGRLSIGAARDVVALVQRQGAIVTIKSNFDGNPAEVRRWSAKGEPDPTWGTNGVTTFPHYDACSDGAFVAGEKILIGCYTHGHNLFARVDRTGHLDTQFGDEGTIVVPYSATGETYNTTMATFSSGEWLSIRVLHNGIAILEAFDSAGSLLSRQEQKIGDPASFLGNGVLTSDNDAVLVGKSTQLFDARFLVAKFEGPGGTVPTWSNPRSPWDVTGDELQTVTPLDALVVINELNARGPHLLTPLTRHIQARAFYDVNQDSFVSSLDALMVINYLNRGGEPEGESENLDLITNSLGLTTLVTIPLANLWEPYFQFGADTETDQFLIVPLARAASADPMVPASPTLSRDSARPFPKRQIVSEGHDEYFQLLSRREFDELEH